MAPPRIVIQTPAAESRFSRGFYQVEEDALYVPLYPARTFFSYLDSDLLSLQTDNQGQLVFLQLLLPRPNWIANPSIAWPDVSLTADVRLLDFRNQLPEIGVETSPDRSLVRIAFASETEAVAYRLTETLICEVTPNARLTAIWIREIEDDRAAARMAAWRKGMKEGQNGPPETPFRRREIRG
ncbi:MAG: hypothetical protein PHR28_10330 [candidate division Zixibacteria bacterium]|nr:hypothetical protein [candidate division Zixibacteria bacterium]